MITLKFMLQSVGFRVQGSGFGVQGSGFRVQDSGCRVQSLWCVPVHHDVHACAHPPKVLCRHACGRLGGDLGYMVYGLWLKVQGLG